MLRGYYRPDVLEVVRGGVCSGCCCCWFFGRAAAGAAAVDAGAAHGHEVGKEVVDSEHG